MVGCLGFKSFCVYDPVGSGLGLFDGQPLVGPGSLPAGLG